MRRLFRREDRGAAVVEAAFVVTLVLFPLVIGTIEFGYGFRDWLSVSSATREGARVGSAAGDDTNADCVILEATAGALTAVSDDQVEEVWVFKSDTSGTVGIRQRFRPAVPTDNPARSYAERGFPSRQAGRLAVGMSTERSSTISESASNSPRLAHERPRIQRLGDLAGRCRFPNGAGRRLDLSGVHPGAAVGFLPHFPGRRMSELSGSLADFTLSAVIRLLAAGDKSGILVINGVAIDGSIFFDAGEVAFATTRKHHQDGNSPENDRREGAPDIGDTMIADVVTRLTRQGRGTFTFQTDVQPVHEVTTTFSADHILELVEERLEVWNDVLASLGSTDQPYRIAGGLEADENVKLKGHEWNVLAALGRGRSASDVAAVLRLPELETAQTLVRLNDDGLVEPSDVTADSGRGANLNGGRLVEPEPEDILVNLTDAVVASMDADDGVEESTVEEPASDLAGLVAKPQNLVPRRTGSSLGPAGLDQCSSRVRPVQNGRTAPPWA